MSRVEGILKATLPCRAVPGINCAMPCAPLKLTALGLKRLSCQISRMKKSAGSS